MADISKEIQAFKDARKGKEVRGSMISLAEKVNKETEKGISDIAAQVKIIQDTNKHVNDVAQAADNTVVRANQTINRADTVLVDATEQAANAAGSATLSESWAHGGTGSRKDENTNNSEYHSGRSETYAEQSKQEADRASMYANFVTPEFLIINNQVYIKEKSTVDFKVLDNRIYMKLPA